MNRPLRAAARAVAMLCSILAYVLALGGCAGVPIATVVLGTQAALAAASSAYCTSTTEDAKQAVRGRLTGGVAVIPCQEAE